jgi:hypothetical protein
MAFPACTRLSAHNALLWEVAQYRNLSPCCKI